MSLVKKDFGVTSRGESVHKFILSNDNFTAELIDYGATIVSLICHDRNGKPVDTVLGYETFAEYENNDGYLGACIGRYANRIDRGRFTLNGKEYRLNLNDGANHLHGGNVGFSAYVWDTVCLSDNSVTFSHVSPDGDENYPGRMEAFACYTLLDDGIKLELTAKTDAPTVVNLTNHVYFNLDGGGTALDNYLKLYASKFSPINNGLIPTGEESMNEVFNFSQFKKIGRDIASGDEQIAAGGGYDHNYVLDKPKGTFGLVAEAYSEKTGILMSAYTDNIAVQFYSGNFLDGARGKKGAIYGKRCGFCLEMQNVPNAVNNPKYLSPVLNPNEEYKNTIVYRFTNRRDINE